MSITFANIITNTENRRIGSKFNVKIVLRRLIDVSDLCACALLSDIDSNQIGHIVFLWKLWIVCFAMRHCTEKKKWEKCVFKKSNCLKCVAFKEAWKIVWVFFFLLSWSHRLNVAMRYWDRRNANTNTKESVFKRAYSVALKQFTFGQWPKYLWIIMCACACVVVSIWNVLIVSSGCGSGRWTRQQQRFYVECCALYTISFVDHYKFVN